MTIASLDVNLFSENSVNARPARLNEASSGPIAPSDLSQHRSMPLHSNLPHDRLACSEQELPPQGLCITVQLSDASFLQQPNVISKKPIELDIKIDIYFNGEVCASAYVPERVRRAISMGDLTHRFSGRRIGRLLEQPWIMVSPENSSKTATEDCKSGRDTDNAHERWAAISNKLNEEAEVGGRNKWGDLSALGDYLASLAKFPMPKEVDDLQKPGELNFGIIDVVLTAGTGRKDDPDTGYIEEPARMRVSELRSDVLGEKTIKQHRPKKVQLVKPSTTRSTRIVADAAIPSGRSDVLRRNDRCDRVNPQEDTYDISRDNSLTSPRNLRSISHTPLRRSIALSNTGSRSTALQKFEASPMAECSSITTELSPANSCTTTEKALGSPLKGLSTGKRRELNPGIITTGSPTGTQATLVQSPNEGIGGPRYSTRARTAPKLSTASSQKRSPRRGSRLLFQMLPDKRCKGVETVPTGEERQNQQLRQQQQRKRARMPYEIVLTNKQTLTEEMEDIAKTAAEETKRLQTGAVDNDTAVQESIRFSAYQTRRRTLERQQQQNNWKERITPPLDPSLPAQTSKIVILRVPKYLLGCILARPPNPNAPSFVPYEFSSKESSPLTSLETLSPLKPLSPQPSFQTMVSPNSFATNTAAGSFQQDADVHMADVIAPGPLTPRPNTPTCQPLTSTPKSKPTPRHKLTSMGKPHPQPKWYESPISQDCVITYAPQGVMRQVKAERTGWFRESSVLVGMRFLVR